MNDHPVMPCVQVTQRQGAFVLEVCHVRDLLIPVTGHSLTAGSLFAQATLALYGGHLLPYYLHEETGWSLSVDELKSQTYKVTSGS